MLEAAVAAQKRGILPVFIITEMKWSWEHAKMMGCEVNEVFDIETGELIKEHKFQSKDFEELLNNNTDLKEYCYNQICKEQVLQYSNKLGIDDVEFAEGEVLGDD